AHELPGLSHGDAAAGDVADEVVALGREWAVTIGRNARTARIAGQNRVADRGHVPARGGGPDAAASPRGLDAERLTRVPHDRAVAEREVDTLLARVDAAAREGGPILTERAVRDVEGEERPTATRGGIERRAEQQEPGSLLAEIVGDRARVDRQRQLPSFDAVRHDARVAVPG